MKITSLIKRPTLILDKEKTLRNIKRMAEKARKSGVTFRPHFKTHQSAEVGEYFRSRDVSAITVSSVDMARYFANQGWKDITIAFPVNLRQIDEINELAEKMQLNLLVESDETVHYLKRNLKYPVDVWIKVDVGYGRTGIPVNESARVVGMAKEVEKVSTLAFKGLLTHSGHAYHAHSVEEVKGIYQDTVLKLNTVRSVLVKNGFYRVGVSIGDTPTCSLVESFEGVDEIRPGNFVFYDVMQLMIGSCSADDIAVAVACPVVAKHEERGEMVIYGGAVHFSKEYVVTGEGADIFGLVAADEENRWGAPIEGAYVSSLSQEHGVVKAGPDLLGKTRVGDVLLVLPVHSCLTLNLLGDLYSTEDADKKLTTLRSCAV